MNDKNWTYKRKVDFSCCENHKVHNKANLELWYHKPKLAMGHLPWVYFSLKLKFYSTGKVSFQIRIECKNLPSKIAKPDWECMKCPVHFYKELTL